MIVGMDFGTTNSGMAVYDGRSVQVLPLDPANANPKVARTALYIMNDQTVHIGRAAVDHYFAQNVGRAVKMQKVWIGELEVYGADMYFVTDAYAWVDVFSPGRLFLSIKTSLRDASYAGTVVGQFYYSLEDLISLYLTTTKVRAEKLLGQELRQVVLGRPVRFAFDPEHDQLAQARLLNAAVKAGYEKIYFQTEPIAAAFSYETTIQREQNVLVFDFGGGTLDITVMRLGNPKRRAVLASDGIPVAGDVFDQKLVRAKFTRHFGEGSLYGPRHKALTVPRWIYDSFSSWETILELQSADNRRVLTEIAQTAQYKFQIEALLSLVSGNYGLQMFDVAEEAKRQLSSKRGVQMKLEGKGFQVQEFVTRSEFESLIRAEVKAVEEHLQKVVLDSGLQIGQIDAVIRTGGSSQIPVFDELLKRLFGPDKVREVDVFSSVTSGLGIIAHGLAAGELELPAHLPGEIVLPRGDQHRPNVSGVNLAVMQKRILLAESETAVAPTPYLALLDEAGRVTAVPMPLTFMPPAPIRQALLVQADEPLLLITSKYRFLLVTARQVAELASLNLDLSHLHPLEQFETVWTMAQWETLKQAERLVLVTSLGFVRPFPIDVLRTSVEAPVPLKFDKPLLGNPVAALPLTGQTSDLLLVTEGGRGVRWETKQIKLAGVQAMNGGEDRIATAVLLNPSDELLLVLEDGYGRRLAASHVPLAVKINDKGKALISRKSPVVGTAVVRPEQAIHLLTTHQWTANVPAQSLPLEEGTKSTIVLKLSAGEKVRALSTTSRRLV